MRMAFGARLAARQLVTSHPWIFYTHVSAARVQRFVPASARRPYAVFLHGIEAWCDLTATQSAVLRGASLRVANSAFTAARVARTHATLGRIDACPLALPPGGPADIEPSPTIDIGPRAVILVGRMSAGERYKGHDQLLIAWPQVQNAVPDARLVFVGHGDDVERLQARAGALGIGDATIFTGFVAPGELAGLYRQAAVFAMPSRGEGFGLAYLEAMSVGLPCIGAREDAAGEVIEDGATGYLVDQADTQQLSTHLIRLLTDSSRRAAMGARGLARVHDQFSYERFAARLTGLLDAAFPSRAPEAFAAARLRR